jgi:hypothetical protein
MKKNRKDEFTALMDEIIEATMKSSKKGDKVELPLLTKNVLYMLINLNHQIEDQMKYIAGMENKVEGLRNDLKVFMRELKSLGYINLGERRNYFKRNILTQEALINSLAEKRIIDRRKLIEEIKRLKKGEVLKK